MEGLGMLELDLSTETDHLERLWSLHPGDTQKRSGHGPGQPSLGDPA